ncbi:helix-turn-helix domain-containing protein [Amycolatopsis sp. NBC_00345]|uniref:helix-turn-helix domain-containing protein n=1 Tax=Amycolatopsis sp. NBC_00345 TaxID=2975955 RepID=UPI002E2684C5
MNARDARSLSAEALEVLRRRAVAAVASGVSRTEVARLFGVSRKTVGAWVAAHESMGDASFRPARRGRRPGEQLALSPAQQAWTVRTVVGNTPDDLGLPHRLWNAQAIVELVNREFRILLSPATASKYLIRWGLIEDRRALDAKRGRSASPVPRTRMQDFRGNGWIVDGAVMWLAWTRPHTPPGAKPMPVTNGQNLMSGFRDYFGEVNVLVAWSNRGVVQFQARRGSFDARQATDFVARLLAQVGRGLNIIIAGWPAQHYELIRTWPEQHGAGISVQFALG